MFPAFKLIPAPFTSANVEAEKPLLCRLIIPDDLPPGSAEIAVSDGTMPLWAEAFTFNGEETRMTLEIPAWMADQAIALMLTINRNRRVNALVRAEISRPDVPPVTVHIIQSACTKLPFGADARGLIEERARVIDRIIERINSDNGESSPESFRWTFDSLVPVVHYIKTRTDGAARLRAALDGGRIDFAPSPLHPQYHFPVFGWTSFFDDLALTRDALGCNIRSSLWMSSTAPGDRDYDMLAACGIDSLAHLTPARSPARFGTPAGLRKQSLSDTDRLLVLSGLRAFNGSLAGLSGTAEETTDAVIDLWIDQCLNSPGFNQLFVHVGAGIEPNGYPSDQYGRLVKFINESIDGAWATTATVASYFTAARALDLATETLEEPPKTCPLAMSRNGQLRNSAKTKEIIALRAADAILPSLSLIDSVGELGAASSVIDGMLSLASADPSQSVDCDGERLDRAVSTLTRLTLDYAASMVPGYRAGDIVAQNPTGRFRRDMLRVPVSPAARATLPATPLAAPVDPETGETGAPIPAQWETVTGRPVLLFPVSLPAWGRSLWRLTDAPADGAALSGAFKNGDGTVSSPFYEIDIADPASGLSSVRHLPTGLQFAHGKAGKIQLAEPFLSLPQGNTRGATARLGKQDSLMGVTHIQRGAASNWRLLDQGPHQATLALDVSIGASLKGLLVVRLFAEFDRLDIELIINESAPSGGAALYWSLNPHSSTSDQDTLILDKDSDADNIEYPYWTTGSDIRRELGSKNGYVDLSDIAPAETMVMRRGISKPQVALATWHLPVVHPNMPRPAGEALYGLSPANRADRGGPRQNARQVPLFALIGQPPLVSPEDRKPVSYRTSITADVGAFADDPAAAAVFGTERAAPLMGHWVRPGVVDAGADGQPVGLGAAHIPTLNLKSSGSMDALRPLWLRPFGDGYQLAIRNDSDQPLTAAIVIDCPDCVLNAERTTPLGIALQPLTVVNGAVSVDITPRRTAFIQFSDQAKTHEFSIG
ncbi:MAG: hypothetical protein ABIH86_07570 [Planctomycetota bacterium]